MTQIEPTTSVAEPKKLLTMKDVMRILGIGKPAAYKLVWTGELPVVKFAGKGQVRYRVRPESLDKWIAEHEEVS